MTPGLAGFIADGSDPQTWDDITPAVLSALAGEFDVVPEPGATGAGTRRTTWLDTFDWRLHKAGLTLEYVPRRGGSELRLSGAGAGADPGKAATQLVTGWQASRPHLLASLAGGPVGTRVAGLVAPRALIPVVATSTVTTVYRLLNEDSKTVARLFIDRPSVVGQLTFGEATPRTPRGGPDGGAGLSDPRSPDGATPRTLRDGSGQQSVPLPPRLTIAEVRGYLGQARRATRLVAAVPGVKQATTLLVADALRAVGRRPGDYSNKVDAEISAGMPASAAAAAILLRLLDTVEANVDGTLKDIDTEFLHDLRVSVRRSRSALKLFGDALGLGRKDLAFFAAEFKWVGDLTTPTRDLDVHLLDFEETARGLAAAKPDDLEPFRAYLVTVGQDSSGPARASRPRSGQAYKAAGETAGLLAAERTRVAFAKVARRGAAITTDTPAEALH